MEKFPQVRGKNQSLGACTENFLGQMILNLLIISYNWYVIKEAV